MKPSFSDLLCIAMLAGGLVLALRPNPRGEVNHILPVAVRNWINDGHDEAANLIAFSILGIFALCPKRKFRREDPAEKSSLIRLLNSRAARVVALMTLVCAIEFAQLFIPGRVSDLNDICTGWSGIFSAWLLSVLLDARAENKP